ncbi:hypothetical protein H6P81_002804 [Aristolochia fimbriata]|uniref:Endonuclease/exonuclease/phosphatase domain-containing protein n=1 Tax=Aristolochia fimbriata TaxID=158543 RepID=A0AAV7FEM8_ARIFI|nr:hypothetical protein H6P81_002804 [Aristolochia fimbriata]
MPNGVYTNKESIAHSVCGTHYEPTRGNAPGPYNDQKKSLIIYLILVNTHISQTNPSKTEVVETLRLLQVARIRKHSVEFARNQDAPILFCGDLNSSYNRKLGNAQWSIHKQGICCTFRWRNSYEPTRSNAPGPYTDRKIIDYISYSENHFEVIDFLCLPNLHGKNAPDGEDFWKRFAYELITSGTLNNRKLGNAQWSLHKQGIYCTFRLRIILKSLIFYAYLICMERTHQTVNTHISQTNPSNTEVVQTLRLLLLITCGTLNNGKLGNAQWSLHKQGIYCTFRLRNSNEPTRGNAPGPYTDRKIIDYISYFENHFEVIDFLCLSNLHGKNAPDGEDFWKRGSDHVNTHISRTNPSNTEAVETLRLLQGNTHISRANPSNTEVVETLTLLQVATIRKYLVEFARNQDAPILFCGNLNSSYNSHAYEIITSGTLNNRKLGNAQWSIHKQGIYCTFHLRNSNEPTRGNAPGPYTDRKIIDYISYSGQHSSDQPKLYGSCGNFEASLANSYEPTRGNAPGPYTDRKIIDYISYSENHFEVIDFLFLPNLHGKNALDGEDFWKRGSDHMPMMSRFIFRPLRQNGILAMPNRVYTNKESIAHSVCGTRMKQQEVNTHLSRTNPSNTEAVETLRLLQETWQCPMEYTQTRNLCTFPLVNTHISRTNPSNTEAVETLRLLQRNSYEPTRDTAPGPYTDKKIIDYISYSENHFEVIDFLCLPNLHGKNSLDGEDFWKRGSDHMPMLSRFFFRPLHQNGIA